MGKTKIFLMTPANPLQFTITGIPSITFPSVGCFLLTEPLNKRKQILFHMNKPQQTCVHVFFGNNHKLCVFQFFKIKPKKFAENTFNSVSLNGIAAFFAYSQPNTARRGFFYKNNEKLCKMLFPFIVTGLKFCSF